MAVPSLATFDLTANTAVIAAGGAGTYHHIVGIALHNNDTTAGNDEVAHFTDGNAGTELYGSTNACYLPARGGTWDLWMSYDYPYWDLSANTALYIDTDNGYRVSGAVWYYTDTTATTSVSHATFDISANTSVVSQTADQTIKVVGLSVHNNDSATDEILRLQDGNGGTDLYGGSNGAIYLPYSGGGFTLGMSYANPWFELSTNTALYLNPTQGADVAGTVWYYKS